VVGETVAETGTVADQSAYFLDKNSGAVVLAKKAYPSSPRFDVYQSGHGAQTFADMNRSLGADVALLRNWVKTSITADGHAAVRPASLVSLTGRGLDVKARGLWLIRNVSHTLRNNLATGHVDYSIDALLCRDQISTVTLQHAHRLDGAEGCQSVCFPQRRLGGAHHWGCVSEDLPRGLTRAKSSVSTTPCSRVG
jgi:hypothetical protein